MPPRKQISRAQPSLPNVPPPQMGEVKKRQPVKPKQSIGSEPRGANLFIIDNSDEQWKAAKYLRDWCDLACSLDIATGYFEIGALLTLDGQWQKLDQIRILMGDEVSKRTKQAFDEAVERLSDTLDESIEQEKEKNDFLTGVPAIVEALRPNGKISCRVYKERKFHAKAYITHARMEVVGSTALVGSSNFTYPGLTENIELNVRIRHDVEELQNWYEHYWNEAEDVTPDILRVIERHTREFTPFEVYIKALHEHFRGHSITVGEWEKTKSRMYPVLDEYQREGYRDLLEIAKRYNGALLCDSVGLGKTFIGLMLIERFLFERKVVALFVPKTARKPVWENKLNRYLPGVTGGRIGNNLVIYNHTDLLRGGDYPNLMDEVKEKADVIIIDEAHHFRNIGNDRYRKLFGMLEGKQVFLLTATPINNSALDLQHQIELFSRRQPDYFRDLGIHSLAGNFRRLETAIKKLVGEEVPDVEISAADAERILRNDTLFRAVVVQRSRAYAVASQKQHGGAQVTFPDRQPPQVVPYSLEKTYGTLLDHLEKAFRKEKPLLSLAIYYPLGYPVKPEDQAEDVEQAFQRGRQAQVVGLIRTQLLKRFESSAKAFEDTCSRLMFKLLAFVEAHCQSEAEKRRLERWKAQNEELLERVRQNFIAEDEEELEDDVLPAELTQEVEILPRDLYRVDEILDETYLDLDQLAVFLNDLEGYSSAHDDKLQALILLLTTDTDLQKHKILIFSEYMATARYLANGLEQASIGPLDEVDSGIGRDRGEIITAFSPYYNDSSSAQLAEEGLPETRVLISTDVLSEGLNLQDATLLINYDLHWNPVRLMQRIGRVDRRLDPEVETCMLADHPEWKAARGIVRFWNFLPPDELDRLLNLYQRVAHKTLRISKIFGIEGRKLLTKEDDYEAFKEFKHQYEGTPTQTETMQLEFQKLLAEHPGLEERLEHFPLRVFSGKRHPSTDARAVFFCYRLPGRDVAAGKWTLDAGVCRWYLYDLQTEKIIEEAEATNTVIRSAPETPRICDLPKEDLVSIRKKIEQHIHNTYVKSVQVTAGVKPALIAWMELN